MHIMEGYLPVAHAVGWGLASGVILTHCGWSVGRTLRTRPQDKFLLAASAAYMFTLSALKLPSLTGSCSHPTGVGLGTVLFGWRPMVVIAAIVLLFQALLLAHGGLTTLGANLFSMGIAGAIVARAVYRLSRVARMPLALAVFLSATLGDLVTYVVTAGQLAWAFPDPAGGFLVSFAKFLGVFAVTQVPLAIAEGLLTVLVLNALAAYDRQELQELGVIPKGRPFVKKSWNLALAAGVVLLLVVPLLLPRVGDVGEAFIGTDDQAKETIKESRPDFVPWAQPIWQPPSSEVETLLFLVSGCGWSRSVRVSDRIPARPVSPDGGCRCARS